MYLNICEKSLTSVFIFCFKENWEEVPFFKVLDKETLLRGTTSLKFRKFRFFLLHFSTAQQALFEEEKDELHGSGIAD